MRFLMSGRNSCAAILLLLLLVPATSSAQVQFGKNKVHYESLQWQVFETPHVRLHYYTEEESLARVAAALAESTCLEFDTRFRMTPRQPIPLLLYSSHHLFQQTNAVSSFISEGTGGLTELIKGRVLVPHTGSWRRLVWVVRHELVHAYMLEKISQIMRQHRRTQVFLPPLWFIEGLAEYGSTTWDEDAEGLLRDAVLTRRALPLTRSLPIEGTVLMYKEGQSFLMWLAQEYGSEKVFDLLDNWHRADDFETVFRLTFGTTLAEADERWFQSLRRRYFPQVADLQEVGDAARRMTQQGRFNMGVRALPAPAGDTTAPFVYFAASEGATDLMVSRVERGVRRERRLLRGGTSQRFESFHLFQNRPDAAASGAMAMASKRGARDAVYVLDRRGRVRRTLAFPSLVVINDPSLVPGDTAVVFSAQDLSGNADLYRARWSKERTTLERLTNDAFDDLEPDVAPDGRWVWFASDRSSADGLYALHRLSLETGAIERMSWPASGEDRQPVVSPDGRWVLYRSTREGTSDLYVRPVEGPPEARRLTRLQGPAFDPDWVGPRRALFTGQNAVQFQIYAVEFDPDTLAATPEPTAIAEAWSDPPTHQEQPGEYERRLGLDMVQNGISLDPGAGAFGAAQMALSDLLGNEQYFLYLSNDSQRFGNFWDGFEGGITYVNRSQRFNYGVGFFRLTQLYDVQLDLIRREKRAGIVLLGSYPFNKFTRIEGNLLLRHASNHVLANGTIQDVDLVSNFLSLVHDNTRWTWMGPSGGSRFSMTTGVTRDLTSGAGDFVSLLGEVRHYQQPVPMLVSATRVQAQASLGRDAQRIYLGGFSTLRGYPRRVLAGTQTLLASQEVRFPLLQGLVLGLPMRWGVPTVSAALLADMAWSKESDFDFSQRLGGAGFGIYLGGGYYPAFRWNWVWPTTDFRNFGHSPVTQFSIAFNY
jgi:hypothetical protein